MTNFVISETDQLIDTIKKTVKIALIEHEQEKRIGENLKCLTINQVAKRIGRSHATVGKMIRNGVLPTTKDGFVPEIELQKYINGK